MVKIVSKLDNLSYKKYIVQEKNDLPSNYKRLEYIQSSGTQYIDTGIKPKTNMKVEIDYEANELTSAQNSSFFGCYQNSYGFFDGVAGTNAYYVNYTAQPVSSASFSLNTRYKDIIYETTFNHNGVDYTATNVSSCDYSMYLFGRNYNNSVERIGTTKIYNFKLWEDEKLELDLVPCKNSVNEIGMYDIVNGVFYENRGTGTFIGGCEINNIVNYNIANLQTPIEYRGVEYLQSTGTQFIDTNVLFDFNTELDMTIGTTNDLVNNSDNAIFGDGVSGIRIPSLSVLSGGVGEGAWTSNNVTPKSINTLVFSKSQTKFNEASLTMSQGNNLSTNTMLFFKDPFSTTPGHIRNSNIKLYRLKITKNNVLVRDFVPVVRKSDSVAGFYNLCGTRKNLFDITTSRIKNVGSKQSDGSYYLSQASVIGIWTPGNKVLFNGESNKQYTISCKVKEGNMITVGWFYSDGTYSSGTPRGTYSNFTLVSSISDASKTVVGFGLWYGTNGSCYIKDVMINEGSTKQDYEPYGDFYINQGTGTFNVGSTKYIY